MLPSSGIDSSDIELDISVSVSFPRESDASPVLVCPAQNVLPLSTKAMVVEREINQMFEDDAGEMNQYLEWRGIAIQAATKQVPTVHATPELLSSDLTSIWCVEDHFR